MNDIQWIIARGIELYRSKGIITTSKYTVNFLDRVLTANCSSYYQYKLIKLQLASDPETDAKPFKILWVDPSAIKFCTGNIDSQSTSSHLDHTDAFCVDKSSFGQVRGGEWDQSTDRFTDLALYQAIEDRYDKGYDWENTDFFQKHIERIQSHGKSFSCESRSELIQSCRNTDQIYRSIKNDGYKTQRKLGNLPLSEIIVNIGRDGRFLFNGGGRHRLSIAKILGIETIPVVVLVRHKKWQLLRNNLRNANNIKELTNVDFSHPDLMQLQP